MSLAYICKCEVCAGTLKSLWTDSNKISEMKRNQETRISDDRFDFVQLLVVSKQV
jgi:hypothetical protein